MRRNDFNKSCKYCGSNNTMLNNDWSRTQYRCRDCGEVYEITPNICRSCGEWIADAAEYCEWHSRGFSDGMEDVFTPEGICDTCGTRPSYKIFHSCKECLDRDFPEWRDIFSGFSFAKPENDQDGEFS